MRLLDISLVVKLNHLLIEKYGGDYFGADNLLNPNSLDWALNAIRQPIFGINRYPTIFHKAAIIAWTIVVGHVFADGNKRTGFVTSVLFLNENGFEFIAEIGDVIRAFENLANRSESGFTLEMLTEWYRKNSVEYNKI